MKLHRSTLVGSLGVAVCAFVASGYAASQPRAKPQRFPVIPGKSVGRVNLGDTQAMVRKKMGKPSQWKKISSRIAADGWFGPEPKQWSPIEQRFFIVTYKNGRVEQIEYNGPEFVTARGISIGSSLKDFRSKYKRIRARSYLYRYEGGGGHNEYYFDAVRTGIAFQFGTQDTFDETVLPQSLRVHRSGVPVMIAPGGVPNKS